MAVPSPSDLAVFLSQPRVHGARYARVVPGYWIKHALRQWSEVPRVEGSGFVLTGLISVLTSGQFSRVQAHVEDCALLPWLRDQFLTHSMSMTCLLESDDSLQAPLSTLLGEHFRFASSAWLLNCAELQLRLCGGLIRVLSQAEGRTELELTQAWTSLPDAPGIQSFLRAQWGSALPAVLGCSPTDLPWLGEGVTPSLPSAAPDPGGGEPSSPTVTPGVTASHPAVDSECAGNSKVTAAHPAVTSEVTASHSAEELECAGDSQVTASHPAVEPECTGDGQVTAWHSAENLACAGGSEVTTSHPAEEPERAGDSQVTASQSSIHLPKAPDMEAGKSVENHEKASSGSGPAPSSTESLEAGRLGLLRVLELAIPPAWARFFHSGDLVRLTDNLTNFARLNSCPWIVTWLKSFDLGFMSLLQDPAAPLQDYRATLERVLALPSAPRDLETHPDFLLEPTLLAQLPFSPALLQQWLAVSLLVVTRFETHAMELKVWPMVEEMAQLATELLILVKLCKDGLLLGLALLGRDVTTHPAVHQTTPFLLLDRAILPSVPVLRFLLQGGAHAMVNQLRQRAFSSRHPSTQFSALHNVHDGFASSQGELAGFYTRHYFHPYFWIMEESAPPVPSQKTNLEAVGEELKECLENDIASMPVDDAIRLGTTDRWETPDEVFCCGKAPLSPRLCSLMRELIKSPPSLLRELLFATAERLVRYEKLRAHFDLHYKQGFTPSLLGVTVRNLVFPSTIPSEDSLAPCDLAEIRRTLKRVWIEVRVANRGWLLRQFPRDWPRDFKAAVTGDSEHLLVLECSRDHKRILETYVKLYGASVIYGYQSMLKMHEKEYCSEPMVDVYALPCLPLIFIPTITPDNNFECAFARSVLTSYLNSHLWNYNPFLRIYTFRPMRYERTACTTDPATLRKDTAELQSVQDRVAFVQTFTTLLGEICNLEPTLTNFTRAHYEWTECFVEPGKKFQNQCEMLLFGGGNFILHSTDLVKMIFETVLTEHANTKTHYGRVVHLKNIVSRVLLEVYWAGYLQPELCALPSFQVLRDSRQVLITCGTVLIRYVMSLASGVMREGEGMNPPEAWVWTILGSVCALITDVIAKISPETLREIKSLKKECFEEFEDEQMVNLKCVPLPEGTNVMKYSLKNHAIMWQILCKETKMYEKKKPATSLSGRLKEFEESLRNTGGLEASLSFMTEGSQAWLNIRVRESEATLASRMEAMLLDLASGGEEASGGAAESRPSGGAVESRHSGGAEKRCPGCKKVEGTAGFKADYCSTQCKDKHAQEIKKQQETKRQESRRRRCPNCKKVEGTRGFKGDYCSTQCRNKHVLGSKEKQCLGCKKPEGTPGFNGDYCSTQCRDKNAQESKEKRCLSCKKPEGTAGFKGDYCSTQCKNKHAQESKKKRCLGCKKPEGTPGFKGDYCSAQCKDKHTQESKEKRCLGCKKPEGTPGFNGDYCSTQCKDKHAQGSKRKRCLGCNKPEGTPGFNGDYCSAQCKDKHAQGTKEKRCPCCQKPEGTAGFNGDYCSAQCRDKWRAREEKRCTFCRRSKDRSSGFLRVRQRAFCSPQCRDQWRANGSRPYETGARDCSHCGRAERKDEQFSKCPECDKEPPFPVPNFYCSVQCRDTWWGLEHQAQHLEFELGLPWWDSPN